MINLPGTAHYKGKLTSLFMLVGIAAILLPVAAGFSLHGAASDARQIYADIPAEETALDINASAKGYEANASQIRQRLDGLNATTYEDRNLQGTLAEELLESSLTVDSFNVKTISETAEAREVANKKGGGWGNFNFASVSLSAHIQTEDNHGHLGAGARLRTGRVDTNNRGARESEDFRHLNDVYRPGLCRCRKRGRIMKKNKKKGVFTIISTYTMVLCIAIALIAAGCGVFLTAIDTSLSQRNTQQKQEFDGHRKVLDGVDERFTARFEPPAAHDLTTNLARQGFTALIDPAQINILYGYDEIEHIITNQTVEVGQPAAAPRAYNWPVIKLISMVYDNNTCTTMVSLSGGESKADQRSQVWKWELKDDKWDAITFSSYFLASDVEITQQGISFILSPRGNTSLTRLFVLNK